MMRWFLPLCGLALLGRAWTVQAQDVGAPVTCTVDASVSHPISPYIYGSNSVSPGKVKTLTFYRFGGNRITAYNWVNNASNAGSDWQHQNDGSMGRGNSPAEPVRGLVQGAHTSHASVVVSVPTLGYVAADKNGGGDVNKTPDYLHTRFVESLPKKNAPFTNQPSLASGKVYQDEFVAFLERLFPESRQDPARTIFYALDNEPDLWSSTHARIHPKPVTYAELVANNTAFAAAIKDVAPKALVFGFVSYGYNGFTTLQGAPDANGRDCLEFYLQSMAEAHKKAGRRLIDVLDLHWYTEAHGGGVRVSDDDSADNAGAIAARVQAPRSLWDPTYKEDSWITNKLQGPIRLIPSVREKIDKFYPGTKLSFTEYYYGDGGHISGGIAEADALGIFGAQDVFAASLWHMGRSDDKFIYGAFAMYRDYDGAGSCFGDTSLAAKTSDPERASLYASRNAHGDLVLVALNKTAKTLSMQITLTGAKPGGKVAVFQLTAASPKPARATDASCQNGVVGVPLQPMSVSTLVLSR